jgi:Lrp/AsnC family transcriptional regulator for asnA, asnC and gidA
LGIFLEKASMYNTVSARLETIPEIVECHYTTGQYAIFVKIYAKNNEHLKSVLNDKLQSIEGISSTETFISLEEKFGRQLSVK